MSIANSSIGFREFLLCVAARLAGDETNGLIFILRDQGLRGGFQLYGSDTQFGRSNGPRDERGRDDCEDENRRNLQAFRALINVQQVVYPKVNAMSRNGQRSGPPQTDNNTAIDAELMRTRTPVAYAPPCASTSA